MNREIVRDQFFLQIPAQAIQHEMNHFMGKLV